MKILAAVVTHNRRDLLKRCLHHVRDQTRQPDGIVVINNASTDGTVELLDALGVDYITQGNLGSAGGWQRAILHSQEHGYDAVWLMDDDGYPDPMSLGLLEAAMRPGTACASAVVVCENEPERFVFPFPKLGHTGLPVLMGFPRKWRYRHELARRARDGKYPFAHFFNGALIARVAIEQVGNVDRSYHFFGDEVDYWCRLRAAGDVFSVLAARHFHPDVGRRPLTPQRVYYYLKNSIILHTRYFDKPLIRNLGAVVIVLVRCAVRNGPGEALSYVFGRNARTFRNAILRGFRRQLGPDLDV